jgi:hypothetical protein
MVRCIIIIQFNITKANKHDHMTFQNHVHTWHGINYYGHNFDKMV